MKTIYQIPLPTHFEQYIPEINFNDFATNSKGPIKIENYLYDPREGEGWKEKSSNACFILYNKAKPFLKSKDIAIDIGCRFGEFTSACMQDFNEVYCFDPVIQSAFSFNAHANYKHFNCALGNKPEIIKMFGGCHHNSMQNGKSRRFMKATKHHSLSIPLDYFCFNSKSISLIKIDTEGFEYKVLSGSLETISTHKPLIIMETHGLHMENENANSELDLLIKTGYKIVEKADPDDDKKISDMIFKFDP